MSYPMEQFERQKNRGHMNKWNSGLGCFSVAFITIKKWSIAGGSHGIVQTIMDELEFNCCVECS